MEIEIPLYGEPCTLAVTIWCDSPKAIRLIVEDAENEETMFTVSGSKTYYVRMPMCPDIANVIVLAENGVESGFEIDDVQIEELPTDYSHKYFDNDEAQSFIEFAEEFCFNASRLEAKGTSYFSDDEVFQITYLDQIKEDGQVVPTPARISQTDGMMEVSKADFLRYTVPMRMAILLHEFAHFYLNEVMEDEVEADHNSLQLYLGMGYPRIDAYNVYLDVFENSPSELNKDRYEALNKLFQSNYKGR